MPADLVTLSPVYPPGGALCGEPPEFYRVTARGGAITIDCPSEQEARKWLAHYATESEGT